MFENLKNIFKKNKKREMLKSNSKDTAKERLHLVLMQDRANVSADFLDLMRKEIIEVIKKYIDIDEKAMDVRLTTETNEEGVQGAPALYANIPIINIKDEARKLSKTNQKEKIIQEKPPKPEEKQPKQTEQKKEEKEDKNKQEEVKEQKEKTKEETNKPQNEKKENKSESPKDSNQKTPKEELKKSKNEEATNQVEENKKEKEVKEEKNHEE